MFIVVCLRNCGTRIHIQYTLFISIHVWAVYNVDTSLGCGGFEREVKHTFFTLLTYIYIHDECLFLCVENDRVCYYMNKERRLLRNCNIPAPARICTHIHMCYGSFEIINEWKNNTFIFCCNNTYTHWECERTCALEYYQKRRSLKVAFRDYNSNSFFLNNL